ncbi:MAG: hypothetical protein PUP91_02975 [Rhizonema sp. PD37]|nr:hypothetical protein [Rhizonema sp. PD37]
MKNSTFTGCHDNNFSDRNKESVVVVIANMSLSSINEYSTEAGLDELHVINAKTSAITAFWLDIGRKFEEMKQALKPKEKFRDLVEATGRTVTFVNKLIRATKMADNFPITTAYILGIDMLAQLAQPKYADLIDDFINHPPENQLEASLRMKKFVQSLPKKPQTREVASPWKYKGAAKTSDGLPREYQVPLISETVGLIIEQESENANMPPRIFVEKAVQAQSLRQSYSPRGVSPRQTLERVLSPTSFAFVEPKATNTEVVTVVQEHHSTEAEELKASLNKLELEKTSTETSFAQSSPDRKFHPADFAQIVEMAIALPINLIKSLLPLSKPVKSLHMEQNVTELVPIGTQSVLESTPAYELCTKSAGWNLPSGELCARKSKSEKVFAIGEMVMYCGLIYTVESEQDADGAVECKMANGRTRHISVQFLKKCEVI